MGKKDREIRHKLVRVDQEITCDRCYNVHVVHENIHLLWCVGVGSFVYQFWDVGGEEMTEEM